MRSPWFPLSLVLWSSLVAACSSSTPAADAGLDAGFDAGPPPVTDGGPLGSACTNLDQCAGNLICGVASSCPRAIICADGQCASAGGPLLAETANVSLASTVQRLPTYVQVNLLAPQLVKGGTLDCGGVASGLDAGSLNLVNALQVNALTPSYSNSVHLTSNTDVESVVLQPTPAGPGRVLVLQAFQSAAQADGGDALIATGCATFDDSADAGTVAITLGL